MAKELSMIENNEKGRMARKYFIACEKELKQINQKPTPFLHPSNCRYHFVGNKNKFYMENGIQIFKNKEFGEIRTSGTAENPLFCLADVCKALGLKPSHVRERLDDGVVSTDTIFDNLGRQQVANFVNEDGLYDVILDSRKPEAKQFRKWITFEVLPSIRKHGAYMTQETIEKAITSPDFLIRLATQLKEEKQKRLEAEERNKKLTEENIHKEEVIEGLLYDIPVADMRQRINQIVLKDGSSDIRGKWIMLYDEFDRKYHMKVSTRMTNSGYEGTRMDYIDKELHMITELYDLACKLFESSYEQLMESWGKYAKRAERYKSQA